MSMISDTTSYFDDDDNIATDIAVMRNTHFSAKEKHRLTRKRKKSHRNKLVKIAKLGYFPCGAYEARTGKEDHSTYIKRWWKSNDSCYTYCKAQSNRSFRRNFNYASLILRNIKLDEKTRDELYLCDEPYADSVFAVQNNQYRKFYDLWWIVY
ncbi:MAG: hypothetical protein IIY93_09625 [Clostridia bacterium]|nr:hypothetical protein [Clostridia bacterium]MBQ1553917.1 hypothetical protein [Clostridia bacterium]MBQ4395991.1 hypothetical protein [Clostridia bacterium]